MHSENIGAITWKSDRQICYCREVDKFWSSFDEIEETHIFQKSHTVKLSYYRKNLEANIV